MKAIQRVVTTFIMTFIAQNKSLLEINLTLMKIVLTGQLQLLGANMAGSLKTQHYPNKTYPNKTTGSHSIMEAIQGLLTTFIMTFIARDKLLLGIKLILMNFVLTG